MGFLGHIQLAKGEIRMYVWLLEFFVDPKQNWSDDTRNAQSCPRLELLITRPGRSVRNAGRPQQGVPDHAGWKGEPHTSLGLLSTTGRACPAA